MHEKEASFCKSYAKKRQLPESWSSHPKPAPSQTGSCSLCCREKAVFSLGFLSLKPLPTLRSPCTLLPREGSSSSSLFDSEHGSVRYLPHLALSSKPFPDPTPGAEAADHPLLSQGCPTLLLICVSIRDSEHFPAFLLCRKGQRPFPLPSPSPVKAGVQCTSSHFSAIPRKATARAAMSHEGAGRQGLSFVKSQCPFSCSD